MRPKGVTEDDSYGGHVTHNIAHRGASAYEPANTLRAFDRAIEMGATMLGLDVHLGRGSRLVAVHDTDISQTTDGTGRVTELSLEQIRRFDPGLGECVPIRSEVVELTRGRVSCTSN
jgi:glycerophosphoryl diester phosphodiesterase